MSKLMLNYVVEGEGETLLFIHGLSDNLLYWEVLASFLKKDYQILRIDLRGHGESPLGGDEITVDVYSDDLKSLLDELDIAKVNLIGFSLGGSVALDFAIKYPDMVSSLVLMSTFSRCDDHFNQVFSEFKRHLSRGFGDFYDYMIPMVLCPDVIENNREELQAIKEFASINANVEAYIKAADVCLAFDVDDDLSEIKASTLVLAGRHDEIFPLYCAERLHEKIENSQLVVLDGLKHNLLVGENNAKIVDILKKFYKKIS